MSPKQASLLLSGSARYFVIAMEKEIHACLNRKLRPVAGEDGSEVWAQDRLCGLDSTQSFLSAVQAGKGGLTFPCICLPSRKENLTWTREIAWSVQGSLLKT